MDGQRAESQLHAELERMYKEAEQEGRAAGLEDGALASHLAEAGILVVLCRSGGRLGEVKDVRAEDLRSDGFAVHGPTGDRLVRVDDVGLALLRRHAELVGGRGLLFPTPAPSGVHRAFRGAAGRAGCSRLSGPHRLRQARARQIRSGS